jgi:hypothetical protein
MFQEILRSCQNWASALSHSLCLSLVCNSRHDKVHYAVVPPMLVLVESERSVDMPRKFIQFSKLDLDSATLISVSVKYHFR